MTSRRNPYASRLRKPPAGCLPAAVVADSPVPTPDDGGWYRIEGDIDPAVVAGLRKVGVIDKLSITRIPVVTVSLARLLAKLRVRQLWLWCDVTRPAMRRVIETPGLEVLDVLAFRCPARLASFERARELRVMRANHYMTESDLLAVTRCEGLTELGAQNAELTAKSLAAILALPALTILDLEATAFDDRMARHLSCSTTIEALDAGATRITGLGLGHLVRMTQLRSLDLWATRITESDLPLLLNLPKLEYLSLGNCDGLPPLNAEAVLNLLLAMPNLKRVWLDGIWLNDAQRDALEARLESVNITARPC